MVNSGAFDLFVQYLRHPNLKLRSQCIWGLVNIAGEGVEFRDLCFQHDVTGPLLETLQAELTSRFANGDLAISTTWAISNLCCGKPSPDWNQVCPALPILAQILHSGDEDLLEVACWAIAFLSDCSDFAIEAVIKANIIPSCVALLWSPKSAIQAACVRIIGKISAGDDVQTQTVIDCGALPALGKLLSSRSRSILREACWAISNLTAGNSEQVAAVVKAELIPPVIELLSSHDSSIRLEACRTVSNATQVCPNYLVSQDVSSQCVQFLKMGILKLFRLPLMAWIIYFRRVKSFPWIPRNISTRTRYLLKKLKAWIPLDNFNVTTAWSPPLKQNN